MGRLFINCQKQEDQLKKNAQVTEWQVIWGAKYELDYEVMVSKDKETVQVQIDMPGIFAGKPGKPELVTNDAFKQQFTWKEERAGRQQVIVSCLVYNAVVDRLGPRVVLWATRESTPDELESNKEWKMVRKSGKRGEVDLTVDVMELLKIDAFDSAQVEMRRDGVLIVTFPRATVSGRSHTLS